VQDAFEKLTEQKVSVFGVSTNDVATQLKFSTKEKLNYTLIADSDKKVAQAFKVPLIMNMMASRRAFLFKDGVLVWRDVKGATSTQGEEVLKAIKENVDK
jgi:peroxiredoxin Q/BCP